MEDFSKVWILGLMVVITINIWITELWRERRGLLDYKAPEHWAPGLATSFVFILLFGAISGPLSQEKYRRMRILGLGIFIVMTLSYIIYQWAREIEVPTSEVDPDYPCGYFIPMSDVYATKEHTLFRIGWGITLLVLVVILQFKVDNNDFSLGWVGGSLNNSLHSLTFSLPFIIPIISEFVDDFANMGQDEAHHTNPESLFVNYIVGDSGLPGLPGSDTSSGNEASWWGWLKLIIGPIGLYLFLLYLVYDSSTGLWIFNNKSNGPVKILLLFMLLFPWIMRWFFIQKCSTVKDKNITDRDTQDSTLPLSTLWIKDAACTFEKYGGIQLLLCLSLISVLVYNIDSAERKLFAIFSILSLSYGISQTYILSYID